MKKITALAVSMLVLTGCGALSSPDQDSSSPDQELSFSFVGSSGEFGVADEVTATSHISLDSDWAFNVNAPLVPTSHSAIVESSGLVKSDVKRGTYEWTSDGMRLTMLATPITDVFHLEPGRKVKEEDYGTWYSQEYDDDVVYHLDFKEGSGLKHISVVVKSPEPDENFDLFSVIKKKQAEAPYAVAPLSFASNLRVVMYKTDEWTVKDTDDKEQVTLTSGSAEVTLYNPFIGSPTHAASSGYHTELLKNPIKDDPSLGKIQGYTTEDGKVVVGSVTDVYGPFAIFSNTTLDEAVKQYQSFMLSYEQTVQDPKMKGMQE